MSNQTSDFEFMLWMRSLNINFLYYSTVIILPFGLFFNTLSIVIFLRPRFKKTTNGFNNIIINTINNLLLMVIFAIYYTQSTGKDVLLTSIYACTILSFLARLLAQHSSWIYVILVSERLVCVMYPVEYKIFKYKKVIIAVVVSIVFLFLCGLDSPNLLLYLAATKTNGSANQTLVCTGDALVIRIRDAVVIAFRMVIPFILTILLNIVLVFKLVKIKNQIRSKDSYMLREYRFAFSIIALNVLFILTLLPNLVALIYLNLAQYDQANLAYTRQVAVANFMLYVGQYISAYNYSFNFFINLKANSMFRKEFFRLIKMFATLDFRNVSTSEDNSTLNNQN